ncbi:MAG: gliding motility protein GldL [Prevotellaceae bacterium]|nr:gliding motility protein GldL [Prevotellaceae bacterium]
MAKNKIKNLSVIQRWMDSKPGQMFLNYAYSWGASIVILGALFKLTHTSGADIMLFIGMGTEVIVFFLAGFERPWDTDEETEGSATVAPRGAEAAAQPVIIGGVSGVAGGVTDGTGGMASGIAGGVTGGMGGTIIIGGGVPVGQNVASGSQSQGVQPSAEGVSPVNPSQLAENIASSPILCNPQYAGMTPDMAEATQAYVEQLKSLTETLQQVAEQSARLTRDSEEMENMNRTLTGINKFYEIQLRSVSAQSNTIDDVNAQTVKLAEQLEELNAVYARMVEALKVNMK